MLLTGNEAAPLADFVDATTHLVSGRVVPTGAAADGHHVAREPDRAIRPPMGQNHSAEKQRGLTRQ